ncbi:hypothetical protein [Desulfopila sp. IMCC35008]|uniref:YunG family protein n=1 Tax=Desulfopila sp. IMCC35008 TaxID=2653858 RepID=UPI0013D58516|nr:hypothetical protein [Desulfopila sp. IMCC35008]
MKPERLVEIFLQCWSIKSSTRYLEGNPARGQCSVTALVIHKYFGGEILKTKTTEGPHFYNRINGRRYDITASQFDNPVTYSDHESTRDETMKDTSPDQYHCLEKAFLHTIRKEDHKNE